MTSLLQQQTKFYQLGESFINLDYLVSIEEKKSPIYSDVYFTLTFSNDTQIRTSYKRDRYEHQDASDLYNLLANHCKVQQQHVYNVNAINQLKKEKEQLEEEMKSMKQLLNHFLYSPDGPIGKSIIERLVQENKPIEKQAAEIDDVSLPYF